jgi:hypothetical protein
MTMTAGELLEHAERLQEDLDHKRHQIRNGDLTTTARAGLLTQINALADRVDEIQHQCEDHTAPVITPVPAVA